MFEVKCFFCSEGCIKNDKCLIGIQGITQDTLFPLPHYKQKKRERNNKEKMSPIPIDDLVN